MKNFEEFQFRPRQLVANICRIYINLYGDDSFCSAVSRDGRSYSVGLFQQAEMVLCKIHEPLDVIASFNEAAEKIQVCTFLPLDCSMIAVWQTGQDTETYGLILMTIWKRTSFC